MKRSGGFTLLEILIVLSLLGLFLGLVSVALVGANRAALKADGFIRQLDEVRAAQNFLRDAIGQALPLADTQPGAKKTEVFIGRPSQLLFFAPLPSAFGGGLFQQHVVLHKGRIEVRFAKLQNNVLTPFGDPQQLAGNVKSVQFTYRGLSPTGQDTGWLSQWPWPARLPKAVRLNAELAGAVPWVPQQIALRLDLSNEVAPQ